jgi:hypothetical protein
MSINSIIPGFQGDGSLFNKTGLVKRNVANDLNQGLKNPWHYLDSAGLDIGDDIGDGTTDARAALLAADADGPITLPPGEYRIASNLTLTNDIICDEGACLCPDVGVVVQSTGKIVGRSGRVFGGAGRVILNPQIQDEIYPEWWGAVAMPEPRDRSIGPAGTDDGTGYENLRAVVDSTTAFKAMFRDFIGPPSYGGIDGGRYVLDIKLNGWYAVTDELLIHSIWFNLRGKSPTYNGSGLKWCGTIATHAGLKFWDGNETDTVVTYSQTGTTVTGASGTFSLYDIGKKIVWTSGSDSGDIATITAIISSSSVTVAESQTVSSGTIKYFRLADETSILHITSCDNSIIENFGVYGVPTLSTDERLLSGIRFSWWPGTSVQRRIKIDNCYINDGTGYNQDTREGLATRYGILQGGPHSQDGNNDFHQINDLLVFKADRGIRIEQAQAVDWQINNYGFGFGNVMMSTKLDAIWYGKGWYAASDTWEGVIECEGMISNVAKFSLTDFSCEHLRGFYLLHSSGINIVAQLSGTFIQPVSGLQYRTISVALDGSDYIATVSGGTGGVVGVPGISNFFLPYMEGMMLTWETGTDAGDTAIIDTVISETQAIVTPVSGAIASGHASLTDADGLRVFKIFDGPNAISAQVTFSNFVFSITNAALYGTEYYSSEDTRLVYEIANTENETSYNFTYVSCYSPLLESYIKDTNTSGLYFGATVNFCMLGCRHSDQMANVISRRYFNGTEDTEGMTSISSYMTDGITSTTCDSIGFGTMLGGLESQIKTKAHRILSNTSVKITIEDFFKANRQYLGLSAYPWQWYGNWSAGGAAITELRFGTPEDEDAWGITCFNTPVVHKSYGDIVYSVDTDLTLSLYVNSARIDWSFSQTGTTVSGAAGSFVTADIGKTIRWTTGANAGSTATIESINSTSSVEVSESQTIASGYIEYPKALQENGYIAVQPVWLDVGINPEQFSTVHLAALPLETVT